MTTVQPGEREDTKWCVSVCLTMSVYLCLCVCQCVSVSVCEHVCLCMCLGACVSILYSVQACSYQCVPLFRLIYDKEGVPKTAAEWDKFPFVNKTHWGYYSWPK